MIDLTDRRDVERTTFDPIATTNAVLADEAHCAVGTIAPGESNGEPAYNLCYPDRKNKASERQKIVARHRMALLPVVRIAGYGFRRIASQA
jgi:hypothetical protein